MKENKFSTFCNKSINAVSGKVIMLYIAIVVILEVLSYMFGGVWAVLSSRIWMISGLVFFGGILYCFCCQILCDVKKKDIISVIGILGLLMLFGFFVGNIDYSDVNPDATQQMAAGISSFSQADWNFTGSAFLGYPNRQYIIASIPAVIFGRSIFTLHLGFAMPFFFGIIMMYLGLRDWCGDNAASNKFALMAVYALLAFRFVSEYFMNFEQALTPISLTMLLLGTFLKFMKKPSSIYLVGMFWIGTFCAGSYTPVLATLGLFLLFCGLYAWDVYKNTDEKYSFMEYPVEVIKALCSCMFGIGIITITILTHTKPEKMEQEQEKITWISYCFQCIRDFFYDKDAVFFGGLGAVVLVYIILSLTFRLKKHDFIIAIWVLAVVVLANYMTGYTTYQKAWILQRTLIIIPVLIVGIVLAALPYLKKIQTTKGILIVLIAFGLTGLYNFNQPHQSFTYFGYIQPMKYMLSTTSDILKDESLGVEDEFNLIFYTDNQLMTNTECYTRFLFPNAHTYTVGYNEIVEQADFSLPTIIISNENSIGEKYGEEVMEYTYQEQRYDMKVTWNAVVKYSIQ